MEPDKGTETLTTPSINEANVAVLSVLAQSYGIKLVLFAVILALVAWYIRRRRV